MIEKIEHENKIYAIILRSEKIINGVEFLTPKDYPLQLGAQQRKKGEVVQPHIHKDCERKITKTQEMIHVDNGEMEVSFYTEKKEKIKTTVLKSGDTILLSEGGHGMKFIKDTKIIEIKQGPYVDVKNDKEKF